MQFRTITKIEPFTTKIGHDEKILSLGSCFADNMAQRLQRAKFSVTASPTGVLFNPASIAATIERMATIANNAEALPQREELHESNGIWYSYDFHSSMSHSDADTALANMQKALKSGAEAILSAKVVIITFGTAFVYRLKHTGKIVANCHKQPHATFIREMLDIEQITRLWQALLEGVLADKRVIFTVSPVRHLGDGLEQNSLSKAILRVAIEQIVRRCPNACYFPSYEIVMDELRDYRFYADDMAHPATIAVDYIWQRFCEAAFTPETIDTISSVERIVRASEHRPLNGASEAHRNFCRSQLEQITLLEGRFATMDWSKEKAIFENYL